jgi:hypothetical protein
VTLCVYALVSPPPSRIGTTGVGGERLRGVTVSGITAIVGELRRPPAATVGNLKRYAASIDRLAGIAASILPVRFGTCLVDRAELTVVLRARAAALKSHLRAVRGRVQMTVRLFDSPSRNAARPARARAGRPRVQPANNTTRGTQYLKQRADAAAMRDVQAVAPLRNAVRRYVRDERNEQRAGVVTINHLIPKRSAWAYRAAVERAAARDGTRLIVTGPWPPFAFAGNW